MISATDDITHTVEELTSFSQEDAALRYEDVRGVIRKNKILMAAWNDFDRSVVTRMNADKGYDEVFSVVDAGDILSFSAVTTTMNISYWQNFGGVSRVSVFWGRLLVWLPDF